MNKETSPMYPAVRVRRMASVCLIGLSAALSFSQASAEDISESHLKAARAAIAATHATDRFDNILPAAALGLKDQLLRKNPDMEGLIDQTVDEKTLAMADRRADLEREAAMAYARVFTEDELNSIAVFYKTSAGQKILEKGPAVTVEVLKAAEIWQRGVVRDLTQSVTEALDAKIPQPALPAPAPAPNAPASGQKPAPAPAPAQ